MQYSKTARRFPSSLVAVLAVQCKDLVLIGPSSTGSSSHWTQVSVLDIDYAEVCYNIEHEGISCYDEIVKDNRYRIGSENTKGSN